MRTATTTSGFAAAKTCEDSIADNVRVAAHQLAVVGRKLTRAPRRAERLHSGLPIEDQGRRETLRSYRIDRSCSLGRWRLATVVRSSARRCVVVAASADFDQHHS